MLELATESSMAANKFAAMLHKNCHKIIVILVYTLLEWILILLLLLNSSFSYLIRKFAHFFGLRQSCTWCCALDHIFDPKNTMDSQLYHVCDAHGAEISKLSYCTDHKRLAEAKSLCADCSSSTRLDRGTVNDVSAFFAWMSEGNGEENRCSCCDEILSRKVNLPSLLFKPSLDVLDYVHMKALSSQSNLLKHKERDGDDDQRGLGKECELKSDAGEKAGEVVEEFECDDLCLSRSNEDDESVYLTDMLLQNADYTDSDRFICIELIDTDTPSVSSQDPLISSDTGSTETSIEEDERRDDDGEAAGVEEPEDFPEGSGQQDDCVDEYLSRENLMARMKSVYEELEEERRAAEEAAKETMAMITKLQEEKAAIQMEAIQYQRMMEEQAEYDQEALQLLNDLMTKRDKEKKELEKELEIYRNKVLDYEDREQTVLIRTRDEDDGSRFGSHQEHNLDDSLEEIGGENVSLTEFDDERASILEEFKILEAKLLALHYDDETRNGSESDDMTEKLLPLLEAAVNRNEYEEYENHLPSRIGAADVYERLQALEEDIDFLKHCIGSIRKGGNKGMILVQEILQHLRDLKSLQLSSDALAIKEDQG